jgi:beta-lactamase superfamily II metal-dependent hydrolase
MIASRSIAALALASCCAGSAGSAGCQAPSAAPDAPPLTGSVVEAATTTPRQGDPADDQCLIDFLDMGTGLAVFIRCKPAGGSVIRILYDGGTVDALLNKQGRLMYLLDKGLGFKPGGTIDHVIQSHPHYDHHSDLIRDNGILQNYTVKHVWDPAALHTTVAYGCFIKDVINAANKTGLIYHPARRCPTMSKLECDGTGMPRWKDKATSVKPFDAPSRGTPMVAPYDIPLGVAGLSATILHADPDVESRDANDASIVVKLELFGVKVLLTGDEEAGRHEAADTPPKAGSVEKFLVDKGFDLSAHIVQVPHHGSESSSSNDFQNAVIIARGDRKDTYAVISSGPKVWSPKYNTQLPTARIVESWKRKLGRGRVVSTKLNDVVAPKCALNTDKIAPTPATDKTSAGCNNIEFVISAKARGRKITTATYWPIGGRIP